MKFEGQDYTPVSKYWCDKNNTREEIHDVVEVMDYT